jgi:hypothetical protein
MTVESKRSSGSEDRGRKAPFLWAGPCIYLCYIHGPRPWVFHLGTPTRTDPTRTDPNRTEPKKKIEPEGLTMMLDDVT